MRHVVSVCLGALACLFVIGLAHARAQEPTTTTTAPVTSTTESTVPATTATTERTTTTTTQRATTSTTLANGGRPVPPPPAGPTQTLVPDLLGTPVDPATTTSVPFFTPFTPTTFAAEPTTSAIASTKNSPNGMTLVLATVAWLASFGGLLVYAEERRASRWKHLAR